MADTQDCTFPPSSGDVARMRDEAGFPEFYAATRRSMRRYTGLTAWLARTRVPRDQQIHKIAADLASDGWRQAGETPEMATFFSKSFGMFELSRDYSGLLMVRFRAGDMYM